MTLVPGAEDCCPRCGHIRLGAAARPRDHLCGRCLRAAPPFARARAAFAYGGALRTVVASWKNRPDHTLGPALARLMLTQARAHGWCGLASDTLVVPVPSHWRRVRQRGFNPAGILAAALARRLGFELAPRGLVATRLEPFAKRADRRARERRVRGLYRGGRGIAGRSVLLVDDVVTTGATVTAAARAASAAGAVRVEVAALAGVPRDV